MKLFTNNTKQYYLYLLNMRVYFDVICRFHPFVGSQCSHHVSASWSAGIPFYSRHSRRNITMSGVEFGAPIRREHFGFKEGYAFVNHGSFGAVPGPVLRRQRQWVNQSHKIMTFMLEPNVLWIDSNNCSKDERILIINC